MESLVFLSMCLKRNVMQDIVENLKPFANIDEQDGISYYRAIITFKVLFTLHTMKTVFPETLTQLLLVIGNVYIAATNPKIAVIGAMVLNFQLISPVIGNRLVSYVIIAFMGAISMNIKPYEFVFDAYVFISILWYAFEAYKKEIQKLCSVISVMLTMGWYVKNQIVFGKFSIITFLVLAFAPLRPNRGNKHRHRLLYFYGLMFTWLLYQFHQHSFEIQMIDTVDKNVSDVSHALSKDSLSHNFCSGHPALNSKNVLSVEKTNDGTCSEGFNISLEGLTLTKDGLFSASGMPRKHSKDLVKTVTQNKNIEPETEENIVDKSNLDYVDQKVIQIDNEDKFSLASTSFITVAKEQSHDSSLCNTEETLKEVKNIEEENNQEDTNLGEKQNEDSDIENGAFLNYETTMSKINEELQQKTAETVEIITDVPALGEEVELHQIRVNDFESEILNEEHEVAKGNMNSEAMNYFEQVPELNEIINTGSNSKTNVDDKTLKNDWKEVKPKLEHNENTVEDANVDEEMLRNFDEESVKVDDESMTFVALNREFEQNEEAKDYVNYERNENKPKLLENIMDLINSKIDIVDSTPEKNLEEIN